MFRSHWLCRVSVLSAVLWAIPACGGDDDGGVTVADGGGTASDAGAGGGSVTAANLGIPCDEDTPCPDEGENAGCVFTAEGEPGFCTILCSGTEDTATCGNGYTGPGEPGCFLTLNEGGFACGVICDAPDDQCPADVCDGTSCPGELSCLAVPGEVEFKVCDYEGGGPGPGPDAGVAPRRAVAKPAMVRAYRLRK